MKIEERWKQTPQLVIVHRLVESSKWKWLLLVVFDCLSRILCLNDFSFIFSPLSFRPSLCPILILCLDFIFLSFLATLFFLSLYFHSVFYIPFISLWFHFLISAFSLAKAPRDCVLLTCRSWKTKGIFDDFLSA